MEQIEDQILKKDIYQTAWSACDTFRGSVDPSQYKEYILIMFFLKYISDIWKTQQEAYQKKHPDEPERIERKLTRERFIIPPTKFWNAERQEHETITADFYALYERRNYQNIGELINLVLQAITQENKEKLNNIFLRVDFNSDMHLGETKERNRRLKMLLEDFNKPQLAMNPKRISEDIIGDTYMYLLEQFGSHAGKKAGEFYTPVTVSKLIAELAQAKVGDRICDPTCGSGGLLIQVAKTMKSNNFSLFGMESVGSTWSLAKMNMFIHGRDNAQIEWCNTLTNPTLIENNELMQFEVIVANPPFSLDKWGAEEAKTDPHKRFQRGIPPKSKGDMAFISHMLATSKPKKGKIVVVVPHGVLFRGASEGKIRKQWIEENLLDTVIGLPEKLFLTTSIPVAILIFDRSRENKQNHEKYNQILFIDASKEYQAGKNQNTLQSQHIQKILDTYQEKKEIPNFSKQITLQEIQENQFNLNIPRYIHTFQEEPEIDPKEIQQEIETLECELVSIQKKMKEHLHEFN